MARLSASSSAVNAPNANGHISARTSAAAAAAATSPASSLPVPNPLPTASSEHEADSTLKPVTKLGPNHDDDDEEDEEGEEAIHTAPLPMDETLYPGGVRAFDIIAVQAFCLGTVFTACTLSTVDLLFDAHSQWWRLPAFFSILSIFHFLEFWTQARYNTPALRANSFLLFSNGAAYNIAHGLATVEIFINCLFPAYGQALTHPLTRVAGLVLVVVGQVVRSTAMAQAGVSFNHVVARSKRDTHVLVTSGIYSIFRHPSYFGFFWWGIGTQFLVGNKVCLLGYTFVLWNFFHRRIAGEEKYLVEFFGDKYVEYRERVGTKIPFIR